MDDEKVKWTLDLIGKLEARKMGDKGRLDAIKSTIEEGRSVYDSDKNYLKELHQQLEKTSETNENDSVKTNVERDLILIKKLEQAEIGNPERLEKIKNSLNAGNALSEEEGGYLQEKFEQLEKVDSLEGTIRKALDTIEKLQKAEIGNPERLESMKKILDNRSPLSTEEIAYLNEKAKQLQEIQRGKFSSISETKRISTSGESSRTRPPEWKNEAVTLVLSIVLGLFGLPGVGHIYVGQVGKGIAILIGSLILLVVGIVTIGIGVGIVFLIIYLIIFIWQIIDSRKLCQEFNDYYEEHGEKPW